MQTDVPALPAVCTDGHNRSARNPDKNTKSSIVDVKNHTCKSSSYLASNRKQLHPLVGGPYRNSMRLYALSEPVRSTNKTSVGQRVMSAKMLRVKQLQNQLTDAHYHLNELANENRLLKAIQKRQDSALRKYEGTNAELPRIINSHHEELKVLQIKYKKLKLQHKHTCDLLKDKENEIHSLQSQNKHLMQLSKDRRLEERDKLQMRVSDLNFRIAQQQETIQILNRKLTLESKSLKHQLNAEVAKHKETQKHLNETLEKLKNLEDLLDNREKRLYYSGRLPTCNKGKALTSQSLMNLGNNPNPLKSGCKSRGSQNEAEPESLPKLTLIESLEGKTIPNIKPDQGETQPISETMSSLQQVRKFRLQKSFSRNGSAGRLYDPEKSDDEEATTRTSSFEKLKAKRTVMSDAESEDEEIKKFVEDFEITNGKGTYKLPKQLKRQFGYSASDSESEDTKTTEKYEATKLTNKSRELHTRLTSSSTTLVDSVAKKLGKMKNAPTTSESESEFEVSTKIQISKESYSSAFRRVSLNESNPSNLSVDDFLKLDINATDSDLEMDRLRKANTNVSEKSPDNPLAIGYESSQQRLLNITKSWTDLQEKIKNDREISEKQLAAINEAGFVDEYVLEKKLRSLDDGDILEKPPSKTTENSEELRNEIEQRLAQPEKKQNDRQRLSIDVTEIPHAQRNGVINSMLEEEERTETRKNDEKLVIKKPSSNSYEKLPENASRNNQIEENGVKNEVDDGRGATADIKLVNFNKQKLLAAMKAIDDNENIEFLTTQKHRAGTEQIRSQTTITENLYRGLPTHARKKDDIFKEIFGDGKTDNKLRAGCKKSH